MLVWASFILPRKSAPPADGIPQLGDSSTDFRLRAPSVVASTPTWNLFFAAWIPPLRVPNSHSPDGISSTRKQPWTQFHCMDFPHSEANSLPVHWWDYPHLETTLSLAKPLPKQTNHADNEDQRSEEAWSFWFLKVNGKASQARFKQLFPFQRNMSFILKSSSILNAFLQYIFDYI